MKKIKCLMKLQRVVGSVGHAILESSAAGHTGSVWAISILTGTLNVVRSVMRLVALATTFIMMIVMMSFR
jgi:hypothetical protein